MLRLVAVPAPVNLKTSTCFYAFTQLGGFTATCGLDLLSWQALLGELDHNAFGGLSCRVGLCVLRGSLREQAIATTKGIADQNCNAVGQLEPPTRQSATPQNTTYPSQRFSRHNSTKNNRRVLS